MDQLNFLSIHEISALIQSRKVSPVEVVEQCLEQIEKLNPVLNSFITLVAEQARKEAVQAEEEIKKGKWRGPLHGIPIGIKDFYDTAGIRTTAAFQYFQNRVPAKDAESVDRLKMAGAIVIGKMNMHQLGMGTTGLESFFKPARNPWNNSYIPGGSSSGSAVAVAAGMIFASLDTDAIGSCRLPASCCGVTGFKGTYNLISMKGILEGEQPPDEMIQWFGHAGITTRSSADTALMLDVLAGNLPKKAGSYFKALQENEKFCIGVADNFHADEQIRNCFETAVQQLESLGHKMIYIPAPFGSPAAGLKNIATDRARIAEEDFSQADVIVLPTTSATVPAVQDAEKNPQALNPDNTAFANYFGIPAISVPCGFDRNGLPVGLQIAGRPGEDEMVLHLSHQYQQKFGPFRKPPL